MTPAGHHHGRLAINITTPLDQYVRAHNLGAVYAAETGVQLTTAPRVGEISCQEIGNREPLGRTSLSSISYFLSPISYLLVGDTAGYWPGAPDVAVEVVSPHDLYTEIDDNFMDWLTAGTRMVVIVNPRQHTGTVYRSQSEIPLLTEEDTLDGADVVPGWSIAVRELFR